MIELVDIHKTFGSTQALAGVGLTVTAGTIHGLVGENGAGKSTLMKILTGFITCSSGDIFIDGRQVQFASPRDASRLGIGMLYQEPLDFPQLTVLDTFLTGAADFSPTVQGQRLAELSAAFGFAINPERRIEELTVGERQQLELLRLIRDGVRILILDEPTTGISAEQQEVLFAALRQLRQDGAVILLVSHKLEEIDNLCDRVTVLRSGQVAAVQQRPFVRESLLQAMFTNIPSHHTPPPPGNSGMPILEFSEVTVPVGRCGLHQASVTIHQGEVIGLAGVDGSGQTAFLQAAAGLQAPSSGRLLRFGKPAGPQGGVLAPDTVFLPADRLSEGLFAEMTIHEHHLLAIADRQFLPPGSHLAATQQAIASYAIRGTAESTAAELSGGNQQRLLLSLIPPGVRLVLMENPTRGLDYQSATWVWQQFHQRRPDAIVFASPDLEEIMDQASRVLVFFEGMIVLDTPSQKTNISQLSRAITGHYRPQDTTDSYRHAERQ